MEIMLCNSCKNEQPLDNFANNKNTKTGKHWTCKSCIKAYQLTIKDKLKAYQHDYQKSYKVENKDKINEYLKQWQSENREKCRSYAKKSNEKNPQRMRDYMKVWSAKKRAEKKLAQQNGQQ
jgi:hypothetical protein